MYMLQAEEGYYPINRETAIQFVKYLYDKEGLKRMVREITEQGKETFLLTNYYNEDGIEEKQILDDEYGIFFIERIKNRPELIKTTTFDKAGKNIKDIKYEKRLLWIALEDLSPNLIEVDPITINPFFTNKEIINMLYEGITKIEEQQIRNRGNEIWALSQMYREEQLQYYKSLNKRYHRTEVFELGIAKMLSIRNRERMEEN